MKFFIKNTIFIFSIICIFLSLFITYAYCSDEKELAYNESKIVGDVNGDGKTDSIDFAQMRRGLLGLIDGFSVSNGVWASDLDGNGVFNSIDFATMRQFLLGIVGLPDEIVDSPTPVVSVSPTPELENLSPFDYVLFSSDIDKDMKLFGDINISGDIHSNSGIEIIANGRVDITGKCEVLKEVNIIGIESSDEIQVIKNADFISVPDYSDYFTMRSQKEGTYTSNSISPFSQKKYCEDLISSFGKFKDRSFCEEKYLDCIYYNSGYKDVWNLVGEELILNEEKPLFFDGDVFLSVHTISGSGFVIATGDIIINAWDFRTQGSGIYSIDGNIRYLAATPEYQGLIYAPNGNFDIESDLTIEGSIVAEQIILNGVLRARYSETYLPKDIKNLLESQQKDVGVLDISQ